MPNKDFKIRVAVDIRDLQIAASGAKTFLEAIVNEFKKGKEGYEFYFLETKRRAYTGSDIFLKLTEQFWYFYWKQIQFPWKAYQLKCNIVFCSDFMVPYFQPGFKAVTMFHDAFFWEYPAHYNRYWLGVFRGLAVAAAKKSFCVVTPTLYTQQQIAKFTHIPINKIIPIGEGPKQVSGTTTTTVTTTSNTIKSQLPNTSPLVKEESILHVGTFEKRKNITALIEAFKILKEQGYTNLKLVLVGRTSNKNNLDDSENIHALITKYGLTQEVIIKGYLTDEEVAQAYKNAKIYVFPSINEGFGIPVLEAFKYELPVLIANNTCLPEVAGDAAISFDPYNYGHMANKIKQVLDNEQLRNELVQKGKERLKVYSWEKTVEKLFTLFSSIPKS